MAKTTESRDVAGAIAAGRQRNSNLAIDYDNGMDGSELDAASPEPRSRWAARLAELRAGVEGGTGEFGRFYRIGVFGNASGARNVIRSFEKNPAKSPGVFEMKTRIVTSNNGERSSELWAAVIEPDQVAA